MNANVGSPNLQKFEQNFEKRFQQINDSIPKGFKAIANKIEYIKIEYLNGMLEFLKAYLHNVINLKHSKEFSQIKG